MVDGNVYGTVVGLADLEQSKSRDVNRRQHVRKCEETDVIDGGRQIRQQLLNPSAQVS